MDCRHVILATGASWRRDGTGYANARPVIDAAAPGVFTPDDVLAGRLPDGHVVIYDDDQYYMAGAIAEKLVAGGTAGDLRHPRPRGLELDRHDR